MDMHDIYPKEVTSLLPKSRIIEHEYLKLISGTEADAEEEVQLIQPKKRMQYLLEDTNAELRLRGMSQKERVKFFRGLPDFRFTSTQRIKRLDARMNRLPKWITLKMINFRMRQKGINILDRAHILGVFPLPSHMVKENEKWDTTLREIKRWDSEAPLE